MAKARVTSLRYYGIAGPAFDEAVAHFSGPWGLTLVENTGEVAYLAAEGSPEYYCLRLRKSDQKRHDLTAFGTDSASGVDAIAGSLKKAGTRFISEPGKLTSPGGGYGFRVFDLDGHVIEVSSDVERRPFRVLQPREAVPVKLSHVVVTSPDSRRSAPWYMEHLGLHLSDWIGNMCFMRCTPDHHNFAVFQLPPTQLQHTAWELRGTEEYMRATGRMLKSGAPMWWGPGRHAVGGENTYSFFFDPFGFRSELMSDFEQIPLEGGREPLQLPGNSTYDQWGTSSQMPPDKIPAVVKQPQSGLGEAPPV
jgi:hypothetical protein